MKIISIFDPVQFFRQASTTIFQQTQLLSEIQSQNQRCIAVVLISHDIYRSKTSKVHIELISSSMNSQFPSHLFETY